MSHKLLKALFVGILEPLEGHLLQMKGPGGRGQIVKQEDSVEDG